MNVHIAEIDLRTRTRPSDIKTHYIFGGIHGHVPPLLALRQLSTRQMLAVVRVLGVPQQTRAATAGKSFPTTLDRTGPLEKTIS